MSMYNKDKKHSLNVRFSDDDIEFLQKIATRFNTNMSEVLRQCVGSMRRSFNDKQTYKHD